MSQTTVTINLDSQIKQRFDELCEQFGMSANTAFTVFVKSALRTRSMPVSLSLDETPAEKAWRAFLHAREAAIDLNSPEMTLDEINEEIRLARAERKARLKSTHQ